MNVVRTETTSFNDAKGKAYKVTGDPTNKGTAPEGGTAIASTNTTVFFNDGIMFTFPTKSDTCTADATVASVGSDGRSKVCKGFIDVNGIKAPNKFVKCDAGTAAACEIKNPTDVYPVVFYDSTVLPNSPAAKAVLFSK